MNKVVRCKMVKKDIVLSVRCNSVEVANLVKFAMREGELPPSLSSVLGEGISLLARNAAMQLGEERFEDFGEAREFLEKNFKTLGSKNKRNLFENLLATQTGLIEDVVKEALTKNRRFK